MTHFLRLGIEEDESMSPTLAKLGLQTPLVQTVGRVDLKFSFKRKIGEHEYLVWFSAKAPTNEEGSTLHIEWNIQDYRPGLLTTKQYGPILNSFFRKTVIDKFYRTWFKDIKCSSLF